MTVSKEAAAAQRWAAALEAAQRSAVEAMTVRDPEPSDDNPPQPAGVMPRRVDPPSDDAAFSRRLAAWAVEAEALAALHRRARGRTVVPPAIERSLRSTREAIDALLPASGWT